MIDHFMTFPTEAAARTALAPLNFWIDDGEGGGAWDTSQCIPDVKDIIEDAVFELLDGVLVETKAQVVTAGWSILISMPEVNTALRDMGGGKCRRLMDSRKAHKSAKPHEYLVKTGAMKNGLAADIKEADITRNGGGKITAIKGKHSPVWAGSEYP